MLCECRRPWCVDRHMLSGSSFLAGMTGHRLHIPLVFDSADHVFFGAVAGDVREKKECAHVGLAGWAPPRHRPCPLGHLSPIKSHQGDATRAPLLARTL